MEGDEPRKGQGFLARCMNAHFYFFLWCGCIVSQSMLVSGFLNVVISTIQVEFQMSSTTAAMFPSNYDITVAVSVLIVSHFGSGHKPRTLGIGMLFMSLGAFLFALPHFLYGSDSHVAVMNSTATSYLCNSDYNGSNEVCEDNNKYKSANTLLTIGSVLIGLGATPVYTAGTTFCDEIIHPSKIGMYFGISYGIGAAAPALGFVLGGVFLSFYKTLGDAPNNMTADDPNWVGAWWLGFLLCCVLAFFFGSCLLLFPKEIPECREVRRIKQELNIQEVEPECSEDGTLVDKLKGILPLLKSVCINPVFVLIVFGSTMDAFIVSSFAAFLPKMVESQFGVSSSMAAYLTGAVTVPGAAGGIFIGGYLIKKLKLSGIQCVKYQAWLTLICLVVQLGLLFHCPTALIDGVNTTPLSNANCSSTVISESCQCPGKEVFHPVCLDDVTFRTPCLAACQTFSNQSTDMYEGCCGSGEATGGICDTGCTMLIPYVAMLFLIMFFTFITNVLFLTANLRCVADSERTVALAIQSVAFRVLGSFPGPIVLGAFLDKACILWSEECGEEGACQVYNNYAVMLASLLVAMVCKSLATVSYFAGWKVWAWRIREVSSGRLDTYGVEVNTNGAANTKEVEVNERGFKVDGMVMTEVTL